MRKTFISLLAFFGMVTLLGYLFADPENPKSDTIK